MRSQEGRVCNQMLQKVHDKDGREPVGCDQLKPHFVSIISLKEAVEAERPVILLRRWMSKIFKSCN